MGAEVEALKLTTLLRRSRPPPVRRPFGSASCFPSRRPGCLPSHPLPYLSPLSSPNLSVHFQVPVLLESGRNVGKGIKDHLHILKFPPWALMGLIKLLVSCVRVEGECPLINAAGKLRQEKKILCSRRRVEKQGGSQDSPSLTPPSLFL